MGFTAKGASLNADKLGIPTEMNKERERQCEQKYVEGEQKGLLSFWHNNSIILPLFYIVKIKKKFWVGRRL